MFALQAERVAWDILISSRLKAKSAQASLKEACLDAVVSGTPAPVPNVALLGLDILINGLSSDGVSVVICPSNSMAAFYCVDKPVCALLLVAKVIARPTPTNLLKQKHQIKQKVSNQENIFRLIL
ncbi:MULTISPECIES: hypothetical protein [unclassified Halomonas]|uniref:hypothetical protein n=1 Tax=unclassified Halomonas TaxID=2609666 RepID=UPI0040343977